MSEVSGKNKRRVRCACPCGCQGYADLPEDLCHYCLEYCEDLRKKTVQVGYCPKCGEPLENYSSLDGGWCPKCEEWWPADRVEECMEENE